MRPMRTRPDHPSAAISRSSPSRRQHTIDARLDSWITPNDKFFGVGHYEWPAIDAATWRLDVAGQVGAPLGYTLNDLKARPRQEVTFTLECSGNNGLPFLTSAIGNAKWAGTSLANILEAAKIKEGAKEVVFFGADRGDEVLRPGTPLEIKFTENFARSMSIDDAINPREHPVLRNEWRASASARGAPVRLITPGWYGIANVKWLRRIEVRETRFMGRSVNVGLFLRLWEVTSVCADFLATCRAL